MNLSSHYTHHLVLPSNAIVYGYSLRKNPPAKSFVQATSTSDVNIIIYVACPTNVTTTRRRQYSAGRSQCSSPGNASSVIVIGSRRYRVVFVKGLTVLTHTHAVNELHPASDNAVGSSTAAQWLLPSVGAHAARRQTSGFCSRFAVRRVLPIETRSSLSSKTTGGHTVAGTDCEDATRPHSRIAGVRPTQASLEHFKRKLS